MMRIRKVIRRLLYTSLAAMVPACGGGGGGGGLGTASGALDPAWGDGGVLILSDRIVDSGFPLGLAVDSSFLYAVGEDGLEGSTTEVWDLEKRSLADGSGSATWNKNGVIISSAVAGENFAQALAIDGTFIYAIGQQTVAGFDTEWRIEKRALATGSFDLTFGTNGVVTTNPSAGFDGPQAIVTDGTSMYVAGFQNVGPGNNEWRIEKRLLSDGSLVGTFGAGGIVLINPSSGDNRALGLAQDGTNLYVVGYSGTVSQWRIEKRLLSTGTLDASFGTAGVVLGNAGAAFGLALDSSAMYVGGTESIGGSSQWRIEKRLLLNGSLVAGFGTAGVVTSHPTSAEGLEAIVTDGISLYAGGSDSGGAGNEWRIEKRSLVDGSLQTGFGNDGVITSASSTLSVNINALAVDNTFLYAAGAGIDPVTLSQVWRIEKRFK